jgi:peptidyl-prolyl cis-trans isomerase SurA
MKNALILLVCITANLFAQTNSEPAIATIDGYAARVNNRIITYGEIRETIAPIIPQLAKAYQGEELAEKVRELYLKGRENLIEETLLKEEARIKGFALPPEVLNGEMETIIREKFGNDRALFNKVLAERRMTLDEWRSEMSDRLIMRAYYSQEVLRKINISEEEIQAEYERVKNEFFIPFRVKYRYILLNKGSTEEEQAVKRQQAENTLQKLRDGAGFAGLAAEVSEGDPELSPWRDPADVKEVLRPALRETPAGEFSGLIETDSVFYIIGVESRQEEGWTPLEKVRPAITDKLASDQREKLHKELIERLTARHHIEYYN